MRFTPEFISRMVYDASSPASIRASITCSNSAKKEIEDLSLASAQQVSVPVWHVGPTGEAKTKSASPSQSVLISLACNTLPDSSPFCHIFWRDRLKNVTNPVERVKEIASSFI